FHFVVRSGCTVEVTSSAADRVDVLVSLNDGDYRPPALPSRGDRNYSWIELNQLSAGSGIKILGLEAIVQSLGAVTGGVINHAKIDAIFSAGIKTDEYASLPEIDVLDRGNSVPFAWADSVPVGQGITVSDDHYYPIDGWLEAKWIRPPTAS